MIEIQYTAIGPRISFRGQDLGYLWDEKPAVWPKLSRQDLIDLAQGQDWLPARKLHQVFFWANQKEMPKNYDLLGTALGAVGRKPYLLGRPTSPEEVKANWDLATDKVDLGRRWGLEVWNICPEPGLRWLESPLFRPYRHIHGLVIDAAGKILYAPGDSSPRDPDWLAATPYQDLEALKADALLAWKINPAAPTGKVKRSWLRGKERWGFVQSDKKTWLVGPDLVEQVNPARETVLRRLLQKEILRLEDPTAYLWFQAMTGSKIHKASVWDYGRGYQVGEITVLGKPFWHNWGCFSSCGRSAEVEKLHPEQIKALFEQVGPESINRRNISTGYFLSSEAGVSWFVRRDSPHGWQLNTPTATTPVLKGDTLEDLLALVERHGLSQLLAMYQLTRV
jgi:hypothetical protein